MFDNMLERQSSRKAHRQAHRRAGLMGEEGRGLVLRKVEPCDFGGGGAGGMQVERWGRPQWAELLPAKVTWGRVVH